ncbi:sulfate anion transporter [Irpex rosettiformis]|uniref:Sulfate anion transporter n=1 Tax=Irpex rosettiformis TaxID=378272 RepID=A0ACB8TYR7_9APHY|nr:sulfate anion transporter [Irpex rosettiformis]
MAVPGAASSSGADVAHTPHMVSTPSQHTPPATLSRLYSESSTGGAKTPATMDESTPLLRSPLARDLEVGSSAKASTSVLNTPSERPTRWQKVKYYIPAMQWIPEYSFSLLGGDIIAGITIASILIPQSVSYATSLAKLSPVTGLYSAAIPGIVYAFLGTSRQLNVAPEAALSLLVGQAVSDILHSDPHSHPVDPDAIAIAVTTIITLQAGMFSFLLGFFRLGFLDVVLSRALLRGFITAVAVVIMIEQLIPMLGLVQLQHTVNPHSTLEKVVFLFEYAANHAHILTTIISFSALGILLFIRRIKKSFTKHWFIYRLPEVLVVVIVSTILSDQFDWDEDGVDILGSVPIKHGGSFIHLPIHKMTLRYLRKTTSTAVLIAVAGFLDSIVSAKQNAARYGYSISPNRELVALGAGNIVASFVPGTLPAAGSITRSRVNGDVGARTQMASLVCSGIVLLATFFLLPWLYYLPKCVLAAIICLIVFSLLAEAPHDVIFFWKMRAYTDLSLMLLTFVSTVVWNVEVGIAVSVVMSLLLVVHRSSRARMTILGRIPGTDRWKPIVEDPEAEEDVPGVLIIRIKENLDFANTAQLKERLRRLELYGHDRHHPSEAPHRQHANTLVFHLADVDSVDASAAQILYELVDTYQGRGVGIYITHLRDQPQRVFEIAGLDKLLGEERFCFDVKAAMLRIEGRSRQGTLMSPVNI